MSYDYYVFFNFNTNWYKYEFAQYPEGIYRALVSMARLRLPIYITETGVADSTDQLRQMFLRRYFYAVSQAVHIMYHALQEILPLSPLFLFLALFCELFSLFSL